jgi:hypothetical protein
MSLARCSHLSHTTCVILTEQPHPQLRCHLAQERLTRVTFIGRPSSVISGLCAGSMLPPAEPAQLWAGWEGPTLSSGMYVGQRLFRNI